MSLNWNFCVLIFVNCILQVDIPLDPYLFEAINTSGVEVDLLQKKQFHYFLKVLIALAPGMLILWFIRESVMLLHITSSRYLYKRYNQLYDMAYAENFILVRTRIDSFFFCLLFLIFKLLIIQPIGSTEDTKSMYKEVVLGGDVWDLLDEIMIYMGNPMHYFEKEVSFVRVI